MSTTSGLGAAQDRPAAPPPRTQGEMLSLEMVKWASIEALAKEMQKVGRGQQPDPLVVANHRKIVMEAVDLQARSAALSGGTSPRETPVRGGVETTGPTDAVTGRPFEEQLGPIGRQV